MATVRDRGQLLLIGGLSLAISLVLIAVVLNSAIYTHNLASRYDSADDETVEFNHDLREAAGVQMQHANEEYGDGGYGPVGTSETILDEYVSTIPDIEETVANANAIDGRVVRASHDSGSDVEGVRIVDSEPGGSDFRPAVTSALDTSDEWTVASDVRVRNFRMTVKGSLIALDTSDAEALLDGTLLNLETVSTPSFVAVFDDGTDEWEVAIYEDSTTTDTVVMVHKVGTSVHRTCSVSSMPTKVDFANARFGGKACAPLSFVDDLDGTYDVRYYYGDKISGSYNLVADLPVDGTGSDVGPFTDIVDASNYGSHCGDSSTADTEHTYYPATSSDYPRVSPALYAASLRSTYESDQMSYRGTQRVAPDEPGPAPRSPRITSVSVTDNDPDSANFDVTVDVSDPDGDLSSVSVELLSSGSQVDIATDSTVSGEAGTASLTVSDSSDGTFTLRITVEDGAVNTRALDQTHESDGDTSGCPA